MTPRCPASLPTLAAAFALEFVCPHCDQTLSYADGGAPPNFCGHCGQRLSTVSGGAAVKQIAPSPAKALPETDLKLAETLVGPSTSGAGAAGKWQAAEQMVDEYRLVRILGQGGMGVVWEAEQKSGGRRVALKLLAPNLPRTPETVERFLREARAAAALSHPRSTFVFGAGQFNGQPYIAMELMPGRTLQDEVRSEGALPVNRAVDHILDVIAGLEAAHALDLVHRDVKPSNCFFDSEGRIKVGDFGLSKSLVADATLTRTGAFLGTPQFAAPEQVRGESVDQRTDVYAVGATLFYLLTGEAPFNGDAVAVIAQIASEQAPGIRSVRPELSHTLERVIGKALARDPNNRYGDLRQLRHALAPFATGGVSFADIGRRLAGYMIDTTAANVVATMFSMIGANVIGFFRETPDFWENSDVANPFMAGGASIDVSIQGGVQVFQALFVILWFAVSEGLWGQSLGKRLMKLRVVDSFGEKPSLPRAFLRSVFLPGAIGIPIVGASTMIALGIVPRFPGIFALLSASPYAFWTYIGIAISLLFMLTMRAKNGYRGLHELASGTRVLRLRDVAEASGLHVAAMAPVRADSTAAQGFVSAKEASWGPYRGAGVLGESAGQIVWLGKDDLLGRTAWIAVPKAGAPKAGAEAASGALPEQRRRLERPARLRWLQGNAEAAAPWQAFEAIDGSSLADYLRFHPRIGWRFGQKWLLELSEEFAAGERDGSLPKGLSFDQLWLDSSGRVKLLDAPLKWPLAEGAGSSREGGEPGEAKSSTPFAANDLAGEMSSVGLLAAVAKSCCYEELMPRSAREFCEELCRRGSSEKSKADKSTLETLDWATQFLKESAERPTRIAWDDRLGMLCISMGIEMAVMTVLMFVLAPTLALTASKVGLTIPLAVLILIELTSAFAIPAILAAIFRGGPVLSLLKVELLDREGRQVSRLRAALRNVLVWSPLMAPYAIIGAAMAGPLQPLNETNNDAALTEMFSNPHVFLLLMGGGCGMMVGGLAFFIGVIVALLRPQQGLQDMLAGTHLAPA